MGFDVRKSIFALVFLALSLGLYGTASATPYLVFDVKTGQVISQQDATEPWYPASLTKLMSVYVALKAVRDKRLTFDTPFVVSRRAASMPPSKMGFAPGTVLTLDNLLKMLLVKSANDLAIVLAEGIDGSVEDFAAEMNATARSLGMTDSHFVNPNGLHDPNHYSSARDLGIVARALYRDFPDAVGYFDIGALKLGNQVIPTHNGLMGRYPGIEGMKTGFTCPAGFNIVASAEQNGRQIIAIVLGYPRAKMREMRTAALLDAGFHSPDTNVTLDALPRSSTTTPPNMRDAVCGRHSVTAEEEDFPIDVSVPGASPAPSNASSMGDDTPAHFFRQQGQGTTTTTVSAEELFSSKRPVFEPLDVFLGPIAGWTGPVLQARGEPPPSQAAPVPTTATAYAPTKAKTNSPLAVDPKALPLNRATRHRASRRAPTKAVAATIVSKSTPAAQSRGKHPAPQQKGAQSTPHSHGHQILKSSKTPVAHTPTKTPSAAATSHHAATADSPASATHAQ
ncbi:MAG TPA: serine hydrolase [Beijerinckiaceae bacterium]|nr:serine hydrolase [Beijerinckiaceae bacterium]